MSEIGADLQSPLKFTSAAGNLSMASISRTQHTPQKVDYNDQKSCELCAFKL